MLYDPPPFTLSKLNICCNIFCLFWEWYRSSGPSLGTYFLNIIQTLALQRLQRRSHNYAWYSLDRRPKRPIFFNLPLFCIIFCVGLVYLSFEWTVGLVSRRSPALLFYIFSFYRIYIYIYIFFIYVFVLSASWTFGLLGPSSSRQINNIWKRMHTMPDV